jgi:hypothetical protein
MDPDRRTEEEEEEEEDEEEEEEHTWYGTDPIESMHFTHSLGYTVISLDQTFWLHGRSSIKSHFEDGRTIS